MPNPIVVIFGLTAVTASAVVFVSVTRASRQVAPLAAFISLFGSFRTSIAPSNVGYCWTSAAHALLYPVGSQGSAYQVGLNGAPLNVVFPASTTTQTLRPAAYESCSQFNFSGSRL